MQILSSVQSTMTRVRVSSLLIEAFSRYGLAVVKRLVEALNGTISFESEVGKGTKFVICLLSNPLPAS